jgi:hypothetical protein
LINVRRQPSFGDHLRGHALGHVVVHAQQAG